MCSASRYQIGRGTSTGATWQQSSNIIGIYGEDTWRVTDNLTLNLGLRYDAHTPWVEANNKQANYNFATGNIDLAGQNGASRALYNGFYGGRDFQPRIGFAWTPARVGGRTVVRGAFTISSYMEGTGTNLRLPLNPPFTPAEINASYNNVPLPLTDTTDGIVGQGVNPSCAAPTYACYAGALLRIWDPNVQPAIANQFNLTDSAPTFACHDRSGWVRGSNGSSPDGAVRLRTKGIAVPAGCYSTQPLLFRQPDTLWRAGHGRSNCGRTVAYGSRRSLRARSQTETCRTTLCKPSCRRTWSMAFRGKSPTPTPSACPTARDITEPGTTPPALRHIGRTSITRGQSGRRVTTMPRTSCPPMQFTNYPLDAGNNSAATAAKLSMRQLADGRLARSSHVRTGWPMPVRFG